MSMSFTRSLSLAALVALGVTVGCAPKEAAPVATTDELSKYNIPEGEANKAAQEAAAAAAAAASKGN